MLSHTASRSKTNDLISKFNAQKLKLKKQERELQKLNLLLTESKHESNELYDFNSSIYITIDEMFIIHRANFTAAFFLEIERGRLMNTSLLNFITFNSKSSLHTVIHTLLVNKIKQTVEIEILSKSGERKQVQLEGALLPNQLIRLCLVDITRTRQLELQAFELEKKLRLVDELLQHTSDGEATLNHELRVMIKNQAFSRLCAILFNIKVQVGMDFTAALCNFHEIKVQIMAACQAVLQGEIPSIVLENQSHNLEAYYYYELIIKSLYNTSSQQNEFIFIIKNYTAYKLEARRQRYQHMAIDRASRRSTKIEMVAALSHELNQPLTAIITYSRTCLSIMKNKLSYKLCYNKFLLPL